MLCPNDNVKMVLYEEGVNIFGPGTYLLTCPKCYWVTDDILPGEHQADQEARALTPSERELVKHGIRASLIPKPILYCD